MNFINFEQWKKEFPELIGKYEPCHRCGGEGCRWDEDLEVWWFCPNCDGEGSICQDRIIYNEHIRLTKNKLQIWIEGKPFKVGSWFKRLDVVSDIDWQDIL